MDPLCHTLAGLALARSGLARRTPLATAAFLVGANLPDADAVTYFVDSDLSLLVRRGWTHGLPAVLLWPLLLTGLLLAWDVVVRRRRGLPRARPGPLLALSSLAVASHSALDWLNTYGMRWLMPFDGRWFYGDAVYIVDPWLWLFLGGGCFLTGSARRRSRSWWGLLGLAAAWFLWRTGRQLATEALLLWSLLLLAGAAASVLRPRAHGQERWARIGLAAAVVYVGLLLGLSSAGEAVATRELARLGLAEVDEVLVGPRPADPFRWDVVARTPEAYRWGRLRLLPSPRLEMTTGQLLRVEASPIATAALAAPQVRGLRVWGRYLWHQTEPFEGGWLVFLGDARYVRRPGPGRGFASALVPLDDDLAPIDPTAIQR
jgi:inner membrane protein